jgi:hypothetical protein
MLKCFCQIAQNYIQYICYCYKMEEIKQVGESPPTHPNINFVGIVSHSL